MAYFVSAKDPYQGLCLFAVLPRYSKEKWSFHHQLCLSALIISLLKIKSYIPCGWNGVFGGGDQPLPPSPAHLLSTKAAWLLGESTCVSWLHGRVFFLSAGPLCHMGIAHVWEEYSAWPIWRLLYKYSIPPDATGNTAKQPPHGLACQ